MAGKLLTALGCARRANQLARLRLDPDRDIMKVYDLFKKLGHVKDIPDRFLANIDYEMLQFIQDDTLDPVDQVILDELSRGIAAEVWRRCMAMSDEEEISPE